MSEGFLVQCADGPAEGFHYWAAVEPDEVIALVPNRDSWIRVTRGTRWRDLIEYRRADTSSEPIDEDGDLLVTYRFLAAP